MLENARHQVLRRLDDGKTVEAVRDAFALFEGFLTRPAATEMG
jgi:hypothetical protein